MNVTRSLMMKNQLLCAHKQQISWHGLLYNVNIIMRAVVFLVKYYSCKCYSCIFEQTLVCSKTTLSGMPFHATVHNVSSCHCELVECTVNLKFS